MKLARRAIVVGSCLLPLACQKLDPPQPSHPPATAVTSGAAGSGGAEAKSEAVAATPADASAPGAVVEWSKLVGQCVIAEGYLTGGGKSPMRLIGGSWSIGIAPEAVRAGPGSPAAGGSRVRVRGVVAVRADLPVFIQKPGELPMQGMPVPEGTDLEQARKRFVLEQIGVTPLRSKAQVESALGSGLGKDVSLSGVVWSLNGHYWFNHDGVELHVEGQDAFAEWSSLHGKPVTLSGRLSRRPMPRIDQIVIQPKRDLREAFVLSLSGIGPADSPVALCSASGTLEDEP
jgi:hypothetical protein